MQQIHISVDFFLTSGRRGKEHSLWTIDSALVFCINILFNNKCQCLYPSSTFLHYSHIKITWLMNVLVCSIELCILMYHAFKLIGESGFNLENVNTLPPICLSTQLNGQNTNHRSREIVHTQNKTRRKYLKHTRVLSG